MSTAFMLMAAVSLSTPCPAHVMNNNLEKGSGCVPTNTRLTYPLQAVNKLTYLESTFSREANVDVRLPIGAKASIQ